MRNNVNVINNAGKDITVTVTKDQSDIQIVINLTDDEINLSSLKQGQVFKGSTGTEYILLEFTDNKGEALVLRKDLLPDNMEFGDTNNFNGSTIDKYLNSTYLKTLVADFGSENIIEQDIDLTSFDGLEDYGRIKRKVSLLPLNVYRRCRRFMGKNMPRRWWLLDANSTPSGFGSGNVRYVRSDGGVVYGWYGSVIGVRPFCILKSDVLVSLAEE